MFKLNEQFKKEVQQVCKKFRTEELKYSYRKMADIVGLENHQDLFKFEHGKKKDGLKYLEYYLELDNDNYILKGIIESVEEVLDELKEMAK